MVIIRKHIDKLLSGRPLFTASILQAAQWVMTVSVAHAAAAVLPGLDVNRWDVVGVKLLCPIAGAMFYILIALSVVFVVWAAYKYLTSRGEEENIRTANRTITYAAISIAVALIARGFPYIIQSVFGFGGVGVGSGGLLLVPGC